MTALVRIKPELITAHRLRMEMMNLDDEDIENTIRMKGWAWVLARRSWVYAGEPDFIYRQIREVVIGLPDIAFDPQGIEESGIYFVGFVAVVGYFVIFLLLGVGRR